MTEPQPDPPSDETPSGDPEFEPILNQEDFDKRTKARIARATAKYADYQQLEAKAKRLAELEQANLTESERQTERIRELETQLVQRETAELRYSVASAKGVPADRITGSTREELEQSADDLLSFALEWAAKTQTPPKTPKPVGTSGASKTDARLNAQERAAAALRQAYSLG